MPITKKDYLNLFNDNFIPVYSDLVAFLGDKPQQILIEFENINVHLTIYLENSNNAIGRENLIKAYNHLVRATIDSSKILWIEIGLRLENIVNNKIKRIFAMNMPENELFSEYNLFKLTVKEARHLEMKNVGKNPILCIEKYGEAINIAWNILKKYDNQKARKVIKFKFLQVVKSQFIGFIFGILASFVAAGLWQVDWITYFSRNNSNINLMEKK